MRVADSSQIKGAIDLLLSECCSSAMLQVSGKVSWRMLKAGAQFCKSGKEPTNSREH